MKRPITKTEYIVGAFFALTALLPLATTEDGYTIDVLPPLASVVSDGSELMTDHLAQRRLINQAMEICERRGVECPDVNDYDALRRFIRGESAVHEAASETGSNVITILDLTETQKGMLRRFQRVRVCPDGLDDVLPGFFNLCSTLLKQTPDTRSTIDRTIPIEFFPTLRPSLDQLIKMRNPN